MSAAAPTIQIGSQQHRQILARFFLDSHVDFVPESIVWPKLAEPSRARLTALPFWQEAMATENITSNTVAAAARLEPDPEIRKAIEMQGFEENRHARLLVALTSHYRIKVDMPPRYFGRELIAIFEPVVQEEARHILFFVNWVKYRRSQLPWWKRPAFRLRCAWIILKQVASRIKTARTMGGASDSSDNFMMSAHQEVGESVTLNSLLKVCLSENERRMGQYDARLLRPRLVPVLAKFAYRVLPAGI